MSFWRNTPGHDPRRPAFLLMFQLDFCKGNWHVHLVGISPNYVSMKSIPYTLTGLRFCCSLAYHLVPGSFLPTQERHPGVQNHRRCISSHIRSEYKSVRASLWPDSVLVPLLSSPRTWSPPRTASQALYGSLVQNDGKGPKGCTVEERYPEMPGSLAKLEGF